MTVNFAEFSYMKFIQTKSLLCCSKKAFNGPSQLSGQRRRLPGGLDRNTARLTLCVGLSANSHTPLALSVYS